MDRPFAIVSLYVDVTDVSLDCPFNHSFLQGHCKRTVLLASPSQHYAKWTVHLGCPTVYLSLPVVFCIANGRPFGMSTVLLFSIARRYPSRSIWQEVGPFGARSTWHVPNLTGLPVHRSHLRSQVHLPLPGPLKIGGRSLNYLLFIPCETHPELGPWDPQGPRAAILKKSNIKSDTRGSLTPLSSQVDPVFLASPSPTLGQKDTGTSQGDRPHFGQSTWHSLCLRLGKWTVQGLPKWTVHLA